MDGNALTTRAKGGRMKRLTFRTDMGDDLLDAIAFINPDDAEGLYNLRDIAEHGSDELLYEIANRLAEYEDMEEQGLLLRLPCKMGDKLWIIVTKRPRVYSPEFSFVKKSKLTWNNLQQVLKGLKKTVFTSREEAEKALEDA